MAKPYSLSWFDKHQGPLGYQVTRGFDTMFEASQFMLALLQEDSSINLITLRRREQAE